jgi:putative NADPH-quinone reductase
MRVLVVFAHPSRQSFAAAVREAVMRGLDRAGHEVDLLDLYAEGFDRAMSLAEWETHEDPSRNRAHAGPHVDRLMRAEALVMAFPTWHIHIPAALKCWMDRVWLPGIAYREPKSRWLPLIPLLTHIRHAVAITTYDLPRPIMALVLGNPIRRYLFNMFGAMMGRRARRRWLALDQVDRSAERRIAFLAEVEACAAKLR